MNRNRLLRFAAAFALVIVAVFLSALAIAQTNVATIRIRDACDPKTFNEIIGPGTCVSGRHGTTKFEFFIEELQQDHFPWHAPLLALVHRLRCFHGAHPGDGRSHRLRVVLTGRGGCGRRHQRSNQERQGAANCGGSDHER